MTLPAALLLAAAAFADSWMAPRVETYQSPGGRFKLVVTPAYKGAGDFFLGKDDGRPRVCRADFYEGDKLRWTSFLDNEVAPVRVLISSDGAWVATTDNWHFVGYGPNVVVLYDGKNGALRKRFALADILTREEIEAADRSVSSIWWLDGTPRFDSNTLVLPTKAGERVISLPEGVVSGRAPEPAPPRDRADALRRLAQLTARARVKATPSLDAERTRLIAALVGIQPESDEKRYKKAAREVVHEAARRFDPPLYKKLLEDEREYLMKRARYDLELLHLELQLGGLDLFKPGEGSVDHKDPWGRDVRYKLGKSTDSFTLISDGADGKPDTADDVVVDGRPPQAGK